MPLEGESPPSGKDESFRRIIDSSFGALAVREYVAQGRAQDAACTGV